MSDRVRRRPDRFAPSAGISRANAAITKIIRRSAPINGNSVNLALTDVDRLARRDNLGSSPPNTKRTPNAVSSEDTSIFETHTLGLETLPPATEGPEIIAKDSESMSIGPDIIRQVKVTEKGISSSILH